MERTPFETISNYQLEEAIRETQEATGTISGEEFGNQVEERLEERMTELRERVGGNVDEIVGHATQSVKGYREQLRELVGDNDVGNTEEIGAAGYVVRSSKQTVLSKENTELNVDDEGYRRRVRAHEEVHRDEQAVAYNAQTIRALDDNTGEIVEVSVVGDLTEGHAIRKANQPDSDLVPEYIKHRENEQKLAGIVGENRIDAALGSGDVEALQREIDEKQREQILAKLMNGEGLPNEQN